MSIDNNFFDVKFKQTAGLRTKNRVRDNGPTFEMIKMDLVDGIDGASVLLRSESTGWFGWLPVMEVELHKADGNRAGSE
jgi:hypothetical protein